MSQRPHAAIERILGETADADDVLRRAVAALVAEPEIAWAAVGFLEDGVLMVGPEAGKSDEDHRVRVPISFQGALVGELWADGSPDPSMLEEVASLIAPQVLIGWDTAGEIWQP